VGAPAWTDPRGDRFDIEATLTRDAPTISAEQMWLMIQSMLEDRFQLRTHYELRKLPVYDLIVGKSGPRIKSFRDETSIKLGDAQLKVTRTPSPNGSIIVTIAGTAQSISAFVQQVQSVAGRPVIDKTGLQGRFDFRLEFGQDTASTDASAAQTDQAPPVLSIR